MLLAFLGLLVGIVYYYFRRGHFWSSPGEEPGFQADSAYRVVDLPGRGKGLVATRDIEVRSLVFSQSGLGLRSSRSKEP